MNLPDGPFVLRGVAVSATLCGLGLLGEDACGIVTADLGILDGRIADPARVAGWPVVDAEGLMALPPFIDAHVHLDKAFTVHRTGLADGTLAGAVAVLTADARTMEPEERAMDLAVRMRRSAERALANGTGGMRTHLDTAALPDETVAWDVFADLRAAFAGRLHLQAVALGAAERALAPDFDIRCAQIARRGGILGAFVAPGPVPHAALDALLAGATRHGLALDLHIDETLAPGESAVGALVDRMIATGHEGPVTAGHCCALSLLEGDGLTWMADRIALAGLHVVTLPLTNAFLQDRSPDLTPRRRGIAPVRELIAAGIAVSTASDNVQDAFFPFGDFNMHEILRTTIVGAHLDGDLGGAMDLGLRTPAQATGLGTARIEIGAPADLSLFAARGWIDLLSGSHAAPLVLRAGRMDGLPRLRAGDAA